MNLFPSKLANPLSEELFAMRNQAWFSPVYVKS